MRTSQRQLVAVLGALVCAGVFSAAGHAQDLGLVVSATPGGPPESEVVVGLRPGATQGIGYFYLRQQAGAKAESLKLVATIDGATVDIVPDGGTAGAAVTLDADATLRYTVQASAVATTKVTGAITALAGGKAEQLATLTITRPPGAILQIAGS